MRVTSIFLKALVAFLIFATVIFSDPSESLANEGLGLKMNGAVGATVINGVSYQFFSLRPDVSIGKFGIGLDLSLYFDADGNIREDDWDEGADFIEKIYYVRYGRPGDPFYIRAGNLEPVTLGYGLIMRRYTNSIEWPSVRRIGVQTEVHVGDIGVEAVVGNFREIETPGLVAGRVTFDLSLAIVPIRLGANFAHDGNQYLGARDTDGDGVPDRLDLFRDKDDYAHESTLRSFLSSAQINRLIEYGDLPDINNMPDRISDLTDPVTVFGVDVGLPLIRAENFNLWTYAQFAQIVDYGSGITVPGLLFTMGPFHAGVEYRIFGEEFRGDYFDLTYETNRVYWDEASNQYVTREQGLVGLPSANGIWGDAGATLFNLVEIYGSYQNMSYDGADATQSVYASVGIKGSLIPKVSVAEAYFMQPDADKLFTTDANGTIVGYKIGYEISPGVSLIYDNKSIYHNGKPTRIMTVETALSF